MAHVLRSRDECTSGSAILLWPEQYQTSPNVTCSMLAAALACEQPVQVCARIDRKLLQICK